MGSIGLNNIRIDNSWHSAFCSVDHSTETMLVTIMCHISNERVFFSLSYDVNDIFISHT